ncbi:transcriptional regulator BetI [Variovorax sp. PBL-H6]|uniref:TetR/AcrR family transcriptional regulator n=1 Tax=Variovorax sp. PBL-H6 TaxID=434009 RepID=UPI00131711B9|nr:TetR/AcrR family transcriptional regulator [Variovorax sp. PBL-H6]VTU26893.1 transcriptional regulator BetI [Variovorax sp. PBL-H6]
MASQRQKQADRVPRTRVDKFAERRAELGEAALQTLAALGYARTSLREIAQNSEFSHGVLHYYFSDKVDLIVCSVRQYKARCVTRYDRVTADAASYDEMMEGFLRALGNTLRDEAHMHRLWYDLRAQALFADAFRADVAAIDKSLENMVLRVMRRFSALAEVPLALSPSVLYALFDGLFQHYLLRHLSGSEDAVEELRADARSAIDTLFGVTAHAE